MMMTVVVVGKRGVTGRQDLRFLRFLGWTLGIRVAKLCTSHCGRSATADRAFPSSCAFHAREFFVMSLPFIRPLVTKCTPFPGTR